jgi:hypothetical protein
MKLYFIYSMLFITLFSGCTTGTKTTKNAELNQLTRDNHNNEMLLGKCTRSALMQSPFADWFNKNYAAYKVDSATCNFIRPLLKNKQITVFMGTWCGDSRREVPRILKMLDCCNFPEEKLTLVMVSNLPDAYKQSPQHEERGKNIVRVPTVIIEEKGTEKGRIVEYPVVSLEKDLLKILKQEHYMPNYSSLTGQTGR